LATIDAKKDEELTLQLGTDFIRFKIKDLYSQNLNLYNGRVRISLAKSPLSASDSKVEILEDMVLLGKGKIYSPLLQALIWVLEDDTFNGKNPLENYNGHMALIKKAWGDMNKNDPKWTFNKAVDRLSPDRRLLHYFNIQNIIDEDYEWSRESPRGVYEDGAANCLDVAYWNQYVMKKGGRKTWVLWVDYDANTKGGHAIMAFEDTDKLIYVMDKKGPMHHLKGPFVSLKKIPYNIRGYL